jgi:hypothetical protein
MNWEILRGWLDNPILVKHARSRLRPQAFFSTLAVVLVLCICIIYAGFTLHIFITGGAAGTLLALQALLLVIVGAGQVSGSVNGARASGILDFHRVSPLTPTELVLGFFFGAPIREYLLYAATLPALAVCMALGLPSPRGAVQIIIALFATAWTFQGVALLNALMSRAKAPTGNIIGMIVFVIFMVYFGIGMVMGGVYSINLVEGENRLSFYGVSLPWLPVVLLYQSPTLLFLFLAARRKMQSARLHPLSKPQAIVAMLICGVLVLGGIWRQDDYDIKQIVAVYLLAVPAILLITMVTPNQA